MVGRVEEVLQHLQRFLLPIQPQSALALVLVRTMACVAVIRQNRADIPVEVDFRFFLWAGDGGTRDHEQEREESAERQEISIQQIRQQPTRSEVDFFYGSGGRARRRRTRMGQVLW